ncbi:hypothetical protein STCU_12393 [Strigomonas culicis]|uniref:Uncharacterized protein n=1 Tax=Strigomonas culicis TaxID=28005 RepID=S9UWV8_9TRYP|nr:hypothetical protein STCU_12393 [Strigomonas culicis]|eukprot:EPY14995.1 hypothetical protein STCU_12393 [Strigomonas culicis]
MDVSLGRHRRFFGLGAADVDVEGEPRSPAREVTSVLQGNWANRQPLLGTASTTVARPSATAESSTAKEDANRV